MSFAASQSSSVSAPPCWCRCRWWRRCPFPQLRMRHSRLVALAAPSSCPVWPALPAPSPESSSSSPSQSSRSIRGRESSKRSRTSVPEAAVPPAATITSHPASVSLSGESRARRRRGLRTWTEEPHGALAGSIGDRDAKAPTRPDRREDMTPPSRQVHQGQRTTRCSRESSRNGRAPLDGMSAESSTRRRVRIVDKGREPRSVHSQVRGQQISTLPAPPRPG